MSGPKLNFFRQLSLKSHLIVSKAFLKSKKRAIPGMLVSSVYDVMSEIRRVFSPMNRRLLCCLRCKPVGASVKCRAQVPSRMNCLFTLRITEYVIFGTAAKRNQSNSDSASGVYLGDQVLNCRPLPRSNSIF